MPLPATVVMIPPEDTLGMRHNEPRRARNMLKWILILSASAALVSHGRAATRAQCSELLRRGLEDKNPETRKQAVVALSLAGQSGPLFSRLEEMLQDKDVEVRQAVVVSLAEVKNKSATAALHKALEDEVPEVSFTAAKALWARNDPAGKQALLAILAGESKTSSSFFSKQKREALRMMHTPQTTFLFAVRQGARFAPVPGLGAGMASMQSILTDSEVPGRELSTYAFPRFEKTEKAGRISNVFWCLDQENYCGSDDIEGISGSHCSNPRAARSSLSSWWSDASARGLGDAKPQKLRRLFLRPTLHRDHPPDREPATRLSNLRLACSLETIHRRDPLRSNGQSRTLPPNLLATGPRGSRRHGQRQIESRDGHSVQSQFQDSAGLRIPLSELRIRSLRSRRDVLERPLAAVRPTGKWLDLACFGARHLL